MQVFLEEEKQERFTPGDIVRPKGVGLYPLFMVGEWNRGKLPHNYGSNVQLLISLGEGAVSTLKTPELYERVDVDKITLSKEK